MYLDALLLDVEHGVVEVELGRGEFAVDGPRSCDVAREHVVLSTRVDQHHLPISAHAHVVCTIGDTTQHHTTHTQHTTIGKKKEYCMMSSLAT
jgi:hypothetical protein